MKRSPMNRATPGAIAWAKKKRQAIARVGKRGKVRKREWAEAKAEHLEQEPDCRGRELLPGPCAGVLDVHHIVPRGNGGGKDYGIYATLCRTHHDWTESNRRRAKELGLLKSPWAVTPRERDEEDV